MNIEDLIKFCLTATEEAFFLHLELSEKLKKEEESYLERRKKLLEQIEELKHKYLAHDHPLYSTINDKIPRYFKKVNN